MAVNDVQPKLYTPLTVGGKKDPVQLQHRVVMAPLTRLRASEDGVQIPLAAEYYAQRSTPGGLLIAEATNISNTAGGYYRAPGIYTKEQVEAWKPVTKAVHDKQGKFFMQMWHTGRVGHRLNQPDGRPPVSSSATPLPENVGSVAVTPQGRMPYETPRAIELEEIPALIEDYRQAAINAIEAGFDGVEVHSANSYFLEQFICDGVNKRTDKYGGSIENRARLVFEILDAITSAIPSSKVGIRLAPFNLMFSCVGSTPVETYSYVINKLNDYDLAYLHVVEPRGFHEKSDKVPESGVTAFFRPIYKGVFLTCGGFDRADAVKTVEEGSADAIAIGRDFISNPDLVKRFELDLPITPSERKTYYVANGDINTAAVGYTDYPTFDDQSKA